MLSIAYHRRHRARYAFTWESTEWWIKLNEFIWVCVCVSVRAADARKCEMVISGLVYDVRVPNKEQIKRKNVSLSGAQ